MSGNIVAAFRRGDPDLIEAGDLNVGCARNGVPVNRGIRACKQAQSLAVEAVIRVVEYLVEITDAKQQLVSRPLGQHRVQDSRIVLDVDRRDFEIVSQVGTRATRLNSS